MRISITTAFRIAAVAASALLAAPKELLAMTADPLAREALAPVQRIDGWGYWPSGGYSWPGYAPHWQGGWRGSPGWRHGPYGPPPPWRREWRGAPDWGY